MNLRKAFILFITIIISCGVLFAAGVESEGNKLASEGDALFKESKFREAAEKYEAALGKYKEAAKETGEAAMKDKLMKMNKNLYGCYLNGKDYENAVRIKLDTYKLDHKLKNYDQAALIYVKKLKDYNKAIEILKEKTKIKKSAKTYSKIGSYYKKLNDLENSVIYYEKSFSEKASAKTIKNIAYLYKKMGENAKAIDAYSRYLATNPSNQNKAATYKNMGKLYEDLGNTQKSLENYEKSISMNYDKDISLLLLVKYYDKKDLINAKKKVEQLLKKEKNNKDAIYYRARISYDLNKKQEALADFKKITSSPKYGKIAKDYIKSIESE
ncbi:MAG: hypothetical protein CSB55_05395 [Candidatus Cloacimonadota bacterium]|nr:MAG: hypothetical protein CSB55_05395 [Candidatus Cloacimonadota bacterium]